MILTIRKHDDLYTFHNSDGLEVFRCTPAGYGQVLRSLASFPLSEAPEVVLFSDLKSPEEEALISEAIHATRQFAEALNTDLDLSTIFEENQ